MAWLVDIFALLMEWCHSWCPDYWLDIVIFTFFTKVLQFPLSLWCQANSLKMVSLMPAANRIKILHHGDKDAIGEETAALFRRERYHPLLSLVPLAIQIVILMCFVKVIGGIGESAGAASSLAFGDGLRLGIADIPSTDGGLSWLVPLFAGAAAWLLGWSQNRMNPLQREQSRTQQLVTNGISIAISLFLGMFVAAGVGFYWAVSNLLSILVQAAENVCLPPKRYVDYPELRRSQAELAKFEADLRAGERKVGKAERKRERDDYRRFFSVVNKHLVFYAESGGFYKYFKPVIEYLLAHSNVTIHYVTNDPHDSVFSLGHARIRPYYIGPTRIIPLMMKMDADMVVMTTPDLGTYQIKRSYVRKDVEYVYMDHGTSSATMVLRKGAFDHFDTVFMTGRFIEPEIRRMEELAGLPPKRLVPVGYPYLGDLLRGEIAAPADDRLQVLLAPSYQPDNILESCLEELVDSFGSYDFGRPVRLILRPHPQFVRRFPAKWQAIRNRYSNCTSTEATGMSPPRTEIVLDDDFSKPPALYESHVVITDWSSIAFEFSFVTRRPSVFIDTTAKIVNTDYAKIGMEATDITFRPRVGRTLAVAEAGQSAAVVADMVASPADFAAKIDELLSTEFYDPRKAAEVAGRYILDSLVNRKRKETK